MEKRMKARGDKENKIAERIRFSQSTDELKPPEEADLVIENKTVEDSVEKIVNAVAEINQKTE
jgi:guanylate kinase